MTPRFRDGLTVFDARGQWLGNDGKVAREPSKALMLIHGKDAQSEKNIEALRGIYKSRFAQESVMRVDQPCAVLRKRRDNPPLLHRRPGCCAPPGITSQSARKARRQQTHQRRAIHQTQTKPRHHVALLLVQALDCTCDNTDGGEVGERHQNTDKIPSPRGDI